MFVGDWGWTHSEVSTPLSPGDVSGPPPPRTPLTRQLVPGRGRRPLWVRVFETRSRKSLRPLTCEYDPPAVADVPRVRGRGPWEDRSESLDRTQEVVFGPRRDSRHSAGSFVTSDSSSVPLGSTVGQSLFVPRVPRGPPWTTPRRHPDSDTGHP